MAKNVKKDETPEEEVPRRRRRAKPDYEDEPGPRRPGKRNRRRRDTTPEWVVTALNLLGGGYFVLGLPLVIAGFVVGVLGGQAGMIAGVLGAITGGTGGSVDWFIAVIAGLLVLLGGAGLACLGMVLVNRKASYRDRGGIVPGCFVLGFYFFMLTRFSCVGVLRREEDWVKSTVIALAVAVLVFVPTIVLRTWESWTSVED